MIADFDPALDRPHLRYNYTYLLPMERNFDPVRPTVWMQKNWTQSIAMSVLYVILIYAGRFFMKNRKGYELKWPLILWNAGLAIFSILGTARYAPDFVWVWAKFGFTHSICVCAFHHSATGFWTEMFALSKAVELGDTAFLVLRKRPIMFLHWYHHITVMVYTWHAFKDHTAAGRWFIMMNYAVHSVMYTYYALRAAGFRFPKAIPMTVTIMQLSQMIVGIIVAIGTFSAKLAGIECQQSNQNLQLAVAMYFSYFVLFAHFFYQAYFKTKKYDKKVHTQGTSDQGGQAVSNGVAREGQGARKRLVNGDATSNGVSNGHVKVEENGHVNGFVQVSNGFNGAHREENGSVQNGSAQNKYD